MPVTTLDLLRVSTLTGTIDQIRRPNRFLQRLLFSNEVSLPTEDIEIGVVTGDREIAPFVMTGASGVMVGGRGEQFHRVAAPNIRIKRPFRGSDLFVRRPGTPIFATQEQIMAQARRAIAENQQILEDRIVDSVEYLCALAMQGVITYSVQGGATFRITFPRPSANTITLTTFWNDADKTKPRPLQDILSVKTVLAEGTSGVMPTDCLLGSEAVAALLELVESGNVKMLGMDGRQVTAGTMTFVEQYNDEGVIFLGELGGVRFWSYPRTVKVNGVSTPLIRPKYAEFFSPSAASERVLYYAASEDVEFIEAGRNIGRRFSKSWIDPDPGARMILAQSRPLPVPRRVDAWVSMKVVSG